MDLILSDQEIEREFRVYDRAGLVRRMTFESFVAARRADLDLDKRVRTERVGVLRLSGCERVDNDFIITMEEAA